MNQITASLTSNIYSLSEIVWFIDRKKSCESLEKQHDYLSYDHHCLIWMKHFSVDFYQQHVRISDRIEITAQYCNIKYIKCSLTESVTHIITVIWRSFSKMIFQTEIQLMSFCSESQIIIFDVTKSEDKQYMLSMMLVSLVTRTRITLTRYWLCVCLSLR